MIFVFKIIEMESAVNSNIHLNYKTNQQRQNIYILCLCFPIQLHVFRTISHYAKSYQCQSVIAVICKEFENQLPSSKSVLIAQRKCPTRNALIPRIMVRWLPQQKVSLGNERCVYGYCCFTASPTVRRYADVLWMRFCWCTWTHPCMRIFDQK